MSFSPLAQDAAGFTLVGIGVLFDLLSIAALVTTIRGRFSSGFPIVGGFFYLMFTAGAAAGLCRLGPVEHTVLLGMALLALHVAVQYAHYRASRRLVRRQDGAVPGRSDA